MSNGKVTFCFLSIFCVLLSTLVVPPFFQLFNRIEPWVFGLPFIQFWLLFITLAISVLLIVWYKVEEKRGELE